MHLTSGHAEDFETERAELLKRVESCVLQRAEQHKLEAEARRRVDEVRELQKVCLASLLQMMHMQLCKSLFSCMGGTRKCSCLQPEHSFVSPMLQTLGGIHTMRLLQLLYARSMPLGRCRTEQPDEVATHASRSCQTAVIQAPGGAAGTQHSSIFTIAKQAKTQWVSRLLCGLLCLILQMLSPASGASVCIAGPKCDSWTLQVLNDALKIERLLQLITVS